MSLHAKLETVQWVRHPSACTRFPRPFGITGKHEPPPPCQSLDQVHGAQILPAPFLSKGESLPPGDGLFLWDKVGAVAVETADCVPVLVGSAQHPFVMAVHAGWRGLSQGILLRAWDIAMQHGIPSEDLYAVVGPAIGAGKFEVGPEVVAAFSRADTPGLLWSLLKGAEDRWQLDLQQLTVFSLLQMGFSAAHLSVVRSCTYLEIEQWYSYRRDGAESGRNWSWVSL